MIPFHIYYLKNMGSYFSYESFKNDMLNKENQNQEMNKNDNDEKEVLLEDDSKKSDRVSRFIHRYIGTGEKYDRIK